MVRYKFLKIALVAVLLTLCSIETKAQSKSSDTLEVQSINKNLPKTKTLDTKESVSYLGSKLMYQVKKRMNLTTEEEEKEEEKKSKKVALSFLGIKIEN